MPMQGTTVTRKADATRKETEAMVEAIVSAMEEERVETKVVGTAKDSSYFWNTNKCLLHILHLCTHQFDSRYLQCMSPSRSTCTA